MLPIISLKILSEFKRPLSESEYEAEINLARQSGYNAPDINIDDFIITKEQAVQALIGLNVREDTAFYASMSTYRDFPLGRGEEIYSLDCIVEQNLYDNDEEFVEEIGKRYLLFTSIEGEGSYYYDVETDTVYDVNWGEESDMISGVKSPWFLSFYDFLEWYYSE